MDVTITGVVFNAFGQRITGAQTVTDDFGASLIQAGKATLATAGQFPLPNNAVFDASGGMVTLSGNVTIDIKSMGLFLGRTLVCTTALTITLTDGLGPFSCIVQAPPAGNATIAVTGTALINGAQTAITRALAANSNGFAIVPAANVASSYLVGGA
jgi:hypothetical protein